jgi:hypothetical protein
VTDFTAVTLALAVMKGDVTLLFESSFGTMLVRAELLTSVHWLWFFTHNNQILPDERFYFNSEALFHHLMGCYRRSTGW